VWINFFFTVNIHVVFCLPLAFPVQIQLQLTFFIADIVPFSPRICCNFTTKLLLGSGRDIGIRIGAFGVEDAAEGIGTMGLVVLGNFWLWMGSECWTVEGTGFGFGFRNANIDVFFVFLSLSCFRFAF